MHWLNLFAKFSVTERTAGLHQVNDLARSGRESLVSATDPVIKIISQYKTQSLSDQVGSRVTGSDPVPSLLHGDANNGDPGLRWNPRGWKQLLWDSGGDVEEMQE